MKMLCIRLYLCICVFVNTHLYICICADMHNIYKIKIKPEGLAAVYIL